MSACQVSVYMCIFHSGTSNIISQRRETAGEMRRVSEVKGRGGSSEGKRREDYREGLQQRCNLSAADVIPKISSNNSRR